MLGALFGFVIVNGPLYYGLYRWGKRNGQKEYAKRPRDLR